MSKKLTIQEIINRSNHIHNFVYDYSKITEKYINMNSIVDIICFKHGIFNQSMNEHINKKKGCKYCAIDKKRDTTDTFILKAKKIHENKYNYSKVNYKNSKTKIIVICKKHGPFKILPRDHINKKNGCPICKESKGSNKIRKYLEKNNIKYIQEKKFNDCKDKRELPFDFYLPKYNLCIEYDGEQHFKSIKHWGGDEKYKNIQKHDNIKNKYCKDNNIILIRYKYNVKIKFNILEEFLKK